jgi:hypothetical protein
MVTPVRTSWKVPVGFVMVMPFGIRTQ